MSMLYIFIAKPKTSNPALQKMVTPMVNKKIQEKQTGPAQSLTVKGNHFLSSLAFSHVTSV